MLKECACWPPEPHPSPNRRDACVKCGFWINPAWTLNARTVDELLGRLEDCLPGLGIDVDRAYFTGFREHLIVRELAGREKFRHTFLARNLPREGQEEAVDGSLYSFGDILKQRRLGLGDDDIDVRLSAAAYCFKAWGSLAHAKDRGMGAP